MRNWVFFLEFLVLKLGVPGLMYISYLGIILEQPTQVEFLRKLQILDEVLIEHGIRAVSLNHKYLINLHLLKQYQQTNSRFHSKIAEKLNHFRSRTTNGRA